MALSQSTLIATTLVQKGKVRLDLITPFYLFFIVQDHEVVYDMRKGIWSCSCIHESWRGANLEKECYHIKAAKFYWNQKGDGDE